ncbi:MAG: flagellin lysine-N-methylase [Eubacteriales bacterium]|nr:flagellin lysine-N-methylase [Eubacteriales bacterium]
MFTLVPDYYKNFKCLAGECRHSCCSEGWDIEIDKSAEARYKHEINKGSEIGKKLKTSVKFGKPSRFIPNGKTCPLLNGDGLCELILSGGDKMLCQICADHPRFRNFFDDHVEMGVGLCCEEAARLVIDHEGMVRYENLETGEEARPAFFTTPVPLMLVPVNIPEVIERLLTFEILNDEWRVILKNTLKHTGKELPEAFDTAAWANAFLRIKEYLLYRHLTNEGFVFSEVCMSLIIEVTKAQYYELGALSLEDFADIVRIFSSEVEYSQECIDYISSFGR